MDRWEYHGDRHTVKQGDRYGLWEFISIDHSYRKTKFVVKCTGCGYISPPRLLIQIFGNKKGGCRTCLNPKTTYRSKFESNLRYVANKAKSRCQRESDKNFHNYGARGIEFRFETLKDFVDHCKLLPKLPEQDSIDRIDNDGHYEPGNLRWADRNEQNNNKRNTPVIILNGESMSIKVFCSYCPLWTVPKIRGMLKRYSAEVIYQRYIEEELKHLMDGIEL